MAHWQPALGQGHAAGFLSSYGERVAPWKLRASVSASNPRSPRCSSWVEKPLFSLLCLEVCKAISPQEHIMKEHGRGLCRVP